MNQIPHKLIPDRRQMPTSVLNHGHDAPNYSYYFFSSNLEAGHTEIVNTISKSIDIKTQHKLDTKNTWRPSSTVQSVIELVSKKLVTKVAGRYLCETHGISVSLVIPCTIGILLCHH
jgi:hypothetical protein